MQWTLRFSAVSTICQHSSTVKADVTSVRTCLPPFIAASATGTWICHGVEL